MIGKIPHTQDLQAFIPFIAGEHFVDGELTQWLKLFSHEAIAGPVYHLIPLLRIQNWDRFPRINGIYKKQKIQDRLLFLELQQVNENPNINPMWIFGPYSVLYKSISFNFIPGNTSGSVLIDTEDMSELLQELYILGWRKTGHSNKFTKGAFQLFIKNNFSYPSPLLKNRLDITISPITYNGFTCIDPFLLVYKQIFENPDIRLWTKWIYLDLILRDNWEDIAEKIANSGIGNLWLVYFQKNELLLHFQTWNKVCERIQKFTNVRGLTHYEKNLVRHWRKPTPANKIKLFLSQWIAQSSEKPIG